MGNILKTFLCMYQNPFKVFALLLSSTTFNDLFGENRFRHREHRVHVNMTYKPGYCKHAERPL